MPHRIGNDLYTKQTKFYGNQGFCFPGGAFQFLKFHESETTLDKGDFKRGFTVILKVKNLQILLEERLKGTLMQI